MYYGLIQQSTGESWEDTKLYLSTAMPSVGGTVPDLGTQALAFKAKPCVLITVISVINLAKYSDMTNKRIL